MEKPTIFSSAPKPPKQIRVEENPIEINIEKQDLPEKKQEVAEEETQQPSKITVMHPTISRDTVVKLGKGNLESITENTNEEAPKTNSTEIDQPFTDATKAFSNIEIDVEKLPDPEKESAEEQIETGDIDEAKQVITDTKPEETGTEITDPEKESTEEQNEVADVDEIRNIENITEAEIAETQDREKQSAGNEIEVANFDADSNNLPAAETKENEEIAYEELYNIEDQEKEVEEVDLLKLDKTNIEELKAVTEPKVEKEKGSKVSKHKFDAEHEFENLKIPGDDELFQRQYYTMGEVATMFHANQSQIRFWENEFDILQPKKNKKGDRYFRPEDVKNLQVIHHLLRNRRFTIEGAREYLKSNKQRTQDTVAAIASLGQLKSFLTELKANL